MATAKVIAHSFKVRDDLDSPVTLLLAKCDGKEVRVSVPVGRQSKPPVGSEIEITEPVSQYKPRFNKNGQPIEGATLHSANLLTKTTPALVARKPDVKPAELKK